MHPLAVGWEYSLKQTLCSVIYKCSFVPFVPYFLKHFILLVSRIQPVSQHICMGQGHSSKEVKQLSPHKVTFFSSMIIICFMYVAVIGGTFTFKHHIRTLPYIPPLLPAEANVNGHSHACFIKPCIPPDGEGNGLQRLSQNKTEGGVKFSWKPDFTHTKAFIASSSENKVHKSIFKIH